MKRFILALTTLFAVAGAWAYDFTAKCDGLDMYFSYDFQDNTVSMVNRDNNAYCSTEQQYPGVKKLVVPSQVTYNGKTYTVVSIDQYAFKNCADLEEVEIPSTVSSISTCSFEGCQKLTTVNMQYGVKSILNGAFTNCSSLKTINIPNSVYSYYLAFVNCNALEYLEIPNSNLYNVSMDIIAKDCDNLKKVKFLDGITTLGPAFENCPALETIEIPASVKEIKADVFKNCTGLQSITIHGTVTSLGRMFADYGPKELILAEGRTYTLYQHFAYLKNIESVWLPSTLTELGDDTFSGCEDLKKVTFAPESQLKTIASYAFFNCSNLSEIQLPESVEEIKQDAFYNTGIQQIDLSHVKTIEGSAFSKSKLTSVVIPASVTNFGTCVFSGCNELSSATFNAQVDKLPSQTFENCTQLSRLVINTPVTSIGISAFYNCQLLSNINLPNTVESIGSNVFRSQIYMDAITLPASLKTIDSENFYGCEKLHNIKLKFNNPNQLDFNPKGLTKSKVVLYVPRGSKNAFAASSKWSGYFDIREWNSTPQDVNMDDSVNGADIVDIYNYIIKGELSGITEEIADVNQDNRVNGADIVSIYNYIVTGN